MAENSAISWCDDTFNPWVGCTKVSPACDGCYAEALLAIRYRHVQWGPHAERKRTSEGNWNKPLGWNRKQRALVDAARAAGQTAPPPRFVFCASLADVFDNAVPVEWRHDLFDLIRATPHLTWLLLTKRPGNIAKMTAEAGGWPPNAAAGTTCEDRPRTEQNLRALLNRHWPEPPAFFFGSFEPLLEDVSDIVGRYLGRPVHHQTGFPWLNWVIGGGETRQGKHQARPAHPDWFRSPRDECAAAAVPFHFKQWGEWAPGEASTEPPAARSLKRAYLDGDGQWSFTRLSRPAAEDLHVDDEPDVWLVGKANASGALDGVVHDARPEARS